MSNRFKKGELEATQQTVKFFETLLRASIDGIVITDAAQNIIVVNEAFCAFFGQHWRAVNETNLFIWLEKFDNDGPRRWAELEQHVRLKGEGHNVEFRLRCPEPVEGTAEDGMRYLSVNVSLLEQIADEEDGVIISTWRDVTERARAEEALRESEERIRAVVETANDAIITVDSQGDVVAWNNGAQGMFGYSVDEITGQSLLLIMPERYREKHQHGLMRVASGGAPKIIGTTSRPTMQRFWIKMAGRCCACWPDGPGACTISSRASSNIQELGVLWKGKEK